MKNNTMKNKLMKNVILAGTFAAIGSVSSLSFAAQEVEQPVFNFSTSTSFQLANQQEEMTVVYAQQQLFDTEAYKAYINGLILTSAKQLIRDIAVSQSYLAAK